VELPNSGHWHYQQENASPSSLRSAIRELFTRLDLRSSAEATMTTAALPVDSTSSTSTTSSPMKKVPSIGSLTSNTGNTSVPEQQHLQRLQEQHLQQQQGPRNNRRRKVFRFDAMGHSLGTDFLSMSLLMEAHAAADLRVRKLALLDPICFPVEMLASHRAPFWSLSELRRNMPRLPLPAAWAALHFVVRDVHTQQACFRTLNSDACLLSAPKGTDTLVCLGGKDVVVPAHDIARYLQRHQPGFQVHFEEDAGHGDFLEHVPSHPRVRRVVGRLRKFLAAEEDSDRESSNSNADHERGMVMEDRRASRELEK
jgi:hypothetical protein